MKSKTRWVGLQPLHHQSRQSIVKHVNYVAHDVFIMRDKKDYVIVTMFCGLVV